MCSWLHPVEIYAEVNVLWQVKKFDRSVILNQNYCQNMLKITAIKMITTLSRA